MEHARLRVQTFAEMNRCEDVHQIVFHRASARLVSSGCIGCSGFSTALRLPIGLLVENNSSLVAWASVSLSRHL